VCDTDHTGFSLVKLPYTPCRAAPSAFIPSEMTLSIEAYHGTSLESAKEIEANSYNESNKDDEWLGRGIYFFVDGISDPLANASDWAIAQSYDKTSKKNKYEKYAVLRSNVEVEENRLIDLTSQDGLKKFNDIKVKLLDRIFKDFSSAQLRKSPGEQNCAMFNYIASTLRTHAVKHNLYIKNKQERNLYLKLNVPNTTVLCIRRENFKFNAQIVHEGVVS
jgi:hypothetical protein